MSLTIQDVLDVQTKSRRNMRDSFDEMPQSYSEFEQRLDQKFAQRQNGGRDFRGDRFENRDRYENHGRFDSRSAEREYSEPRRSENGYDDYTARYSGGYEQSYGDYNAYDNGRGYASQNYDNSVNYRQSYDRQAADAGREINYFGQDPVFAKLTRPQSQYRSEQNYDAYAGEYTADVANYEQNDRYGDRFLENARREMNSDYTNESADTLYDRLSYTSVREQNPRAIAPRQGFHAARAKSPKGRTKNVKGKIILAVYIAVIVLVATLIIVNAAGINAGTAVTSADTGAYSVTLEGVDASSGYAHSDYGYVVNTNWFDKLCDSLTK